MDNNTFNRTTVECKGISCKDIFKETQKTTFNRTTVECKEGKRRIYQSIVGISFNRTTVECKDSISFNKVAVLSPFNRTTVECKVIVAKQEGR